jgi:hypothetical protein
MTTAIRHLRSLAIALVALAMSASLTFGAAAPQATSHAVERASQVGTNVGSGGEATAGGDEGTETDETTETDPEGDTGDAADNCTTDPTDPATDLTTLSHGQIVCWAAQQPTPDGYANHGAWVSSWAKGNHGAQGALKSQGKSKGTNKPQS